MMNPADDAYWSPNGVYIPNPITSRCQLQQPNRQPTPTPSAMTLTRCRDWPKDTGPNLNLKTVFLDIMISIIQIRRSQDRLIFIMVPTSGYEDFH